MNAGAATRSNRTVAARSVRISGISWAARRRRSHRSPIRRPCGTWGGEWTFEDLNTYVFAPMLTTPGVYMETIGVADETDRANLIAYLRTRSESPVPLP